MCRLSGPPGRNGVRTLQPRRPVEGGGSCRDIHTRDGRQQPSHQPLATARGRLPPARGCQGPLLIPEAPGCPASVIHSQAQPQEMCFPEQRPCSTSDARERVRPLGGRLEACGWLDSAPIMSQAGSDFPLKD